MPSTTMRLSYTHFINALRIIYENRLLYVFVRFCTQVSPLLTNSKLIINVSAQPKTAPFKNPQTTYFVVCCVNDSLSLECNVAPNSISQLNFTACSDTYIFSSVLPNDAKNYSSIKAIPVLRLIETENIINQSI